MQPLVIRAFVSVVTFFPVTRVHTRTYTGAHVDARTLWTARAFNAFVAPRLASTGYAGFREAMDKYGLAYSPTNFTVGHIIPRAGGGSDLGANLMAQHAQDNEWLGCRVVSPGELRHSCRTVDPRAVPAMRRSACHSKEPGMACGARGGSLRAV